MPVCRSLSLCRSVTVSTPVCCSLLLKSVTIECNQKSSAALSSTVTDLAIGSAELVEAVYDRVTVGFYKSKEPSAPQYSEVSGPPVLGGQWSPGTRRSVVPRYSEVSGPPVLRGRWSPRYSEVSGPPVLRGRWSPGTQRSVVPQYSEVGGPPVLRGRWSPSTQRSVIPKYSEVSGPPVL